MSETTGAGPSAAQSTRAMAESLKSLDELRWYRAHLFRDFDESPAAAGEAAPPAATTQPPAPPG